MEDSSRTGGESRPGPWLAVALTVGCLAVLEAFWMGGQVRTLGDFGWDEAAHALWGLRVYRDVAAANWISLAFDSYRQVYWPFLHSWALAASMLVMGATPTAARTVSVAAFVVTAGVLVLIGRRLSTTAGWVASFIAAGLWLTAGPVVETIGLRALTDGPAIAVTGLTFWALTGAVERPTRSRFALVGLLSMATYLTKTGFGVVLIPSILLTFAVWARRDDGPRVDARRVVAYLAPIVVVSILWFAYPPKITATLSALTNRAQGPSPLSWAGLTYHPRQLAGYVGGWWVLALLGIAVAMAALRRSPPIVVALALYIAVALGLHTLSHTKDPKHVTKVVPWLFLLGGWAVSIAWEWCRGRRRPVAMGVAAALCVVLAARAHDLFATPRQRADTFPRIRSALVQRILPDRHNLVLGEFGGLGGPLTKWYLLERNSATLLYPDDHLERFQALLAPLRARHGWIRALERTPPERTLWVDQAPTRDQTDIGTADRLLAELVAADAPARILVLDIAPTSPWYDDRDFVFGGETFLPALGAELCYRRSEVIGPERGVSLSVWDSVRGCNASTDAGSGSEPAASRGGAEPGEAVSSP